MDGQPKSCRAFEIATRLISAIVFHTASPCPLPPRTPASRRRPRIICFETPYSSASCCAERLLLRYFRANSAFSISLGLGRTGMKSHRCMWCAQPPTGSTNILLNILAFFRFHLVACLIGTKGCFRCCLIKRCRPLPFLLRKTEVWIFLFAESTKIRLCQALRRIWLILKRWVQNFSCDQRAPPLFFSLTKKVF